MPKKKENKFLMTFTTGGITYTSKGLNVREAFDSLRPKNIKAKGVLVVEKGGKKYERFYAPRQAVQLFGQMSKTFKEIHIGREIKFLESVFNG